MVSQNNKKIKNNNINKTSNTKKNNTVSKVTGRIDIKKVFPKKKATVEVSEISVEEALSSRVKRYQKLYNNTNNNDKNTNTNNKNENTNTNNKNENKITEKKLSITKQQKFNFDNNKVEDEVDKDYSRKKQNKNDNKVSVKIEEIPIKKALHMNDDYSTIIMLFLTVVIVFLGVFLIYHFSSFDHDKVKVVSKVKEEEVVPENILFLGDSITDFYDLKKYFPDRKTVNSGISGNTTQDILDDMENRAYRYNPSHVFLLIGINDLAEKESVDKIVSNIEEIVKGLKENLPKSKIYLESIYPINNGDEDKINHAMVKNRDNEDVRDINSKLKKFAKNVNITYIDMYKKLENENKDLKLEYTVEGLHINDEGYKKITWEINKVLKEK